MAVNSGIFDLIHSLSKSEKRYFKLFADLQNGEKSYLFLFDIIEKQNSYDEEAAIKALKKKQFKGQISFAKNYLYHLILKSLRSYQSGNNTDKELREQLDNIEILFKKALFKRCKSLISKTKKLALEYEKYPYFLEIIRWERKILVEESDNDKITLLHREEKEVFNKMNNVKAYFDLSFDVHKAISEKGRSRGEKENYEADKLMNSALFLKEEEALSFEAKSIFYTTLSNYNFFKGNLSLFHQFGLQCLHLLEAHPQLWKENPQKYIAALSNVLLSSSSLKQYADFDSLLKKLRSIETDSEEVQIRIFMRSYNNELLMYINKGEFEKGLQVITEVEKGLRLYENKIHKFYEFLFYYLIACTYFGSENYNAAGKYLNKIINDTSSGVAEDILCFARILNLICHFELHNTELLEYILKSTQHFINKRNKMYKFEAMMFKFFRQSLNIHENKKLLKEFHKLKEQATLILADRFENKVLDYFDFISWIDSKLKAQTFAQTIKEKYKVSSTLI
jgi:hypothetical protein